VIFQATRRPRRCFVQADHSPALGATLLVPLLRPLPGAATPRLSSRVALDLRGKPRWLSCRGPCAGHEPAENGSTGRRTLHSRPCYSTRGGTLRIWVNGCVRGRFAAECGRGRLGARSHWLCVALYPRQPTVHLDEREVGRIPRDITRPTCFLLAKGLAYDLRKKI
jgi:hypothetical protein